MLSGSAGWTGCKVYLCLGVNELGIYKDDAFYESYCQAIELIRQAQPNAIIYIQGLIPVNEGEIVNYNGNKYKLSNEHLRVYNDLMRRAAEEKLVRAFFSASLKMDRPLEVKPFPVPTPLHRAGRKKDGSGLLRASPPGPGRRRAGTLHPIPAGRPAQRPGRELPAVPGGERKRRRPYRCPAR